MAQVDIKFATIKFKDGYELLGVSPLTPPSIGATTMATLTGFTGAVSVGDKFTIAGDDTQYTITAHTETSSNTTSITFTPGLVAAPAASAVITVGPHELEVTIGEGNLTYSEKRKLEYKLDRGRLDTVRKGDEEPVDVKLDFRWDFLRADTGEPPTVEDALRQRGEASNWVSSSDDQCEPYAVDVEVLYDPECAGIASELIQLLDFRWEDLAHDLKAGTVSVTGKCNILQATVTRIAAA